MRLTIIAVSLLSGFSAFAVDLPPECVTHLQDVASRVPGDDTQPSDPSNVTLTNVVALPATTDPANGSSNSNFSVDISVALFKGSAALFTGSATVADSAGSCYISKFTISAP